MVQIYMPLALYNVITYFYDQVMRLIQIVANIPIYLKDLIEKT